MPCHQTSHKVVTNQDVVFTSIIFRSLEGSRISYLMVEQTNLPAPTYRAIPHLNLMGVQGWEYPIAIGRDGNLHDALAVAAESIKKTVPNEAVVLLAFDAEEQRFAAGYVATNISHGGVSAELLGQNSALMSVMSHMQPPYVDVMTGEGIHQILSSFTPVTPGIDSVRALLVAQVRIGDHVCGLLLAGRAGQGFSARELVKVQKIVKDTAVVIGFALQTRARHRQSEILAAVAQTGKTITRSMDLDSALKAICTQAMRVAGIADQKDKAFCYIGLRDGNALRFISAIPGLYLNKLTAWVPNVNEDQPYAPGIVARALRTGKAQNVPDVNIDPDYIEIDSDIRSQLSLPIIHERQVIGMLTLEHARLAAFDADHVRGVALLTVHAAAAIQNARHHQLLSELRRLADDVGRGEVEYQHVLKRILDGMITVLNADCGFLYPYDTLLSAKKRHQVYILMYEKQKRKPDVPDSVSHDECVDCLSD